MFDNFIKLGYIFLLKGTGIHGFQSRDFFVAAAIFRTLRSLSLVIGNQNNTSPTTENNGI